MPEIASLAADFEQAEYSADLLETAYASALIHPAASAEFDLTTYSADLGSSDLP